jgi:hypothetical protein
MAYAGARQAKSVNMLTCAIKKVGWTRYPLV